MGAHNRRPLYSEQELAEQRRQEAAAAATAARADAASQASTSGAQGGASTRTASSIAMPAPGALQQQQQLEQGQPTAATAQQQQQLLLTDFEQPCTLKGLSSALYAGALGYFFGVVPAVVKHRARMWGLVHQAGVKSATQLALMSGLYTAVHCIATRIRQKDDGWSRGIAGCSTGLVLGWGGGPMSAAQSCIGIGAISYILDFGGTAAAPAAAHAAVLSSAGVGTAGSGEAVVGVSGVATGQGVKKRQPFEQLLGAALGLPPVMWLGQCCQAEQRRGVAMGVDACPLSVALQAPSGWAGRR